ncbi:hypothetical protein SynBIOSE41_01066 [Synechococcus sp. BIOS-E4-1]|nr:hypothetical protein SynBIOSE41_01066 [Synechococcus sp. BIOS-E4-1]
MANSGLDYLLQFSKIQTGEIIGNIEAKDFSVIKDGSQMGHLIIDCRCTKYNKRFNIAASSLNWKITKFLKGSLQSLDYSTVQHRRKE